MSFDPHLALYDGSSTISWYAHVDEYNTIPAVHCFFCRARVKASLWSNHLSERYHADCAQSFNSYKAIEKDFSVRRQTVTTILSHLSDLGLSKWRDDIRLQLLTYTTDRSVLNLRHVKEAWSKYDLKERTSLLELAIWKAVAQMSKESSASCNALDWHLWSALGWRTAKKDTRHANAIVIIITHVIPFVAVENCTMPVASGIW